MWAMWKQGGGKKKGLEDTFLTIEFCCLVFILDPDGKTSFGIITKSDFKNAWHLLELHYSQLYCHFTWLLCGWRGKIEKSFTWIIANLKHPLLCTL
ncbi:CLUMA_CG016687, isoform A [Clunio marinus]|uniref:CLUMA_CG016687, isoform A n=1 Tax=Clunio marinus TaxID=568069 RepID=A0A1J1IV35_9DIPT|nr:CLUMA_CG016687, isoform A [Clunio marinus]